jgi:hypothetical protein
MLRDFTIDIAYSIKGAYGDPIACVNTVVTYLKDFSGGLKQALLFSTMDSANTALCKGLDPTEPRTYAALSKSSKVPRTIPGGSY